MRKSGVSKGGKAREPKPPGAPTRRHPFPPDWQPDSAGLAFARERGITDIPGELERCRDWHAANGKLTADPAASWRTWCANAQRFRTRDQQQPQHRQQPFVRDRFAWMRDDVQDADANHPDTIDGDPI